jgi:Protein of unknown function (DUF3667)
MVETKEVICPNCQTKMIGKFCHNCGQDNDLRHRNILVLIGEILGDIFQYDSRLWRTIPALLFRPDLLNRDLFEGRIKRHVRPFTIFAIATLLMLFVSENKIEKSIQSAPSGNSVTINAVQSPQNSTIAHTSQSDENWDFDLKSFMAGNNDKIISEVQNWQGSEKDKAQIVEILQNPRLYLNNVFSWAQNLAVLLVPICALALVIVFIFKRQYYLYDHFTFAMNLISFSFLMISFCLLLPPNLGGLFFLLLFIIAPLYTFFALKGAYKIGNWGAIWRALFVVIISGLSFLFLISGAAVAASLIN